jgi:translocation protein SEC63
MTEVKLVVDKPSAAPVDDFEDDISEPDEDTLQGQMEALRRQKAAAPKKKVQKKVVNQDVEDSSDSEDEIDSKSIKKPANYEEEEDLGNEDFIE